jgi:hypothetical protein
MKRIYLTFFRIFILGILMFAGQQAYGQIVFTSVPDSSALVGELYTYDVEAVASPDAPTFSLDAKPTGMTINASTGVISWTPAAVNLGGKVIVKAVNSGGTALQTFYIFVSDAISCPTGLLSYWKMDAAVAGGGEIEDYASGYSAVALSEMADTVGQVNKALKFSGNTQYLRVADESQYNWQRSSDFSFSLWFRHTGNFTDDEVFIARANGQKGAWIVFGIDHTTRQIVLRLRTNWHINDTINDDETFFIDGNVITNNVWHQVTAVYDGNPNQGSNVTIKLFYDGVKYSTTRWLNSEFGFDATDRDLTIGWFDPFQPNSTFNFKGSMDEVAIYNKALSDAEATAIYASGTAKKPLCQAGNHHPLIVSTPVTAINEDVAYSYKLVGRDYEGTALTKSAVKKPSWLAFNTSTGILSGTPRQANVGDTTVTLRVSDGTVTTDQTFAITVTGVNFEPVITSIPADSVDIGEVYSYQIVVTDQDPLDEHTFAAVTKPDWLVFNAAVGVLTGIPTITNLGTHNVVLTASDGQETVEQTFTIVVYNSATGVNDHKSNTLVGRIYPVPAKSTVYFDLNLTEDAKIQVLTLNGKILKQVVVDRNQKSFPMDVNDLGSGIYLYKVIQNNTSQVGKLVVE